MGLVGQQAGLDEPELPRRDALAGPCRRASLEAHRLAQDVGHDFEIGIAEDQPVERPAREIGPAEPLRRLVGSPQQVALEQDGALVMGGHAIGLAQPHRADRRLVPAAIAHDLEQVENLARSSTLSGAPNS
jgi:hypothetical protein